MRGGEGIYAAPTSRADVARNTHMHTGTVTTLARYCLRGERKMGWGRRCEVKKWGPTSTNKRRWIGRRCLGSSVPAAEREARLWMLQGAATDEPEGGSLWKTHPASSPFPLLLHRRDAHTPHQKSSTATLSCSFSYMVAAVCTISAVGTW
jgi:hypothetical protein